MMKNFDILKISLSSSTFMFILLKIDNNLTAGNSTELAKIILLLQDQQKINITNTETLKILINKQLKEGTSETSQFTTNPFIKDLISSVIINLSISTVKFIVTTYIFK